jgi:hypothetical protein
MPRIINIKDITNYILESQGVTNEHVTRGP